MFQSIISILTGASVLFLGGSSSAPARIVAPAKTVVVVAPSHLGSVPALPARLSAGPRVSLPSTEHSAFPGSVRLSDGRILTVWREGSSHLSADGQIWGSTSADNGATWAPQSRVLAMPGLDARDPSLTSIDGVLYMTVCTSQPPAYGNGVYVAHSTDQGATWSVPVRVDGGLPRAGESGPVVAVQDGRLLQAFYGHTATETRDSFYVTYSTGDDAWSAPRRVLDGQADGRDYEEPWAVNVGGTTRVFMRFGNAASIGSVDYDGAAWSNERTLFAGSGRAACVPNGVQVMCVYRQLDPTFKNRPALMRLSADGGATFGAPVVLDASSAMFTYAAPVTSGAGWVVSYAMQVGWTTASTSSHVYARTVTLPARGSVFAP